MAQSATYFMIWLGYSDKLFFDDRGNLRQDLFGLKKLTDRPSIRWADRGDLPTPGFSCDECLSRHLDILFAQRHLQDRTVI